MTPRPSALFAALLLLASCRSAPEAVLDVSSNPKGAEVYLSRRGDRAVRGSLGPVAGDVETKVIEEEFFLIGRTPLEWSSPLEEHESGATVLGIGAKTVREYESGVLRIVKPGYLPVERKVRFHDGQIKVRVRLFPEPPQEAPAETAAQPSGEAAQQ